MFLILVHVMSVLVANISAGYLGALTPIVDTSQEPGQTPRKVSVTDQTQILNNTVLHQENKVQTRQQRKVGHQKQSNLEDQMQDENKLGSFESPNPKELKVLKKLQKLQRIKYKRDDLRFGCQNC